jgi:hypothetical protein
MADWATISALATAGGTFVLAVATYASTRSANRAARVAERSLLAGIRPLLIPTRPDDPYEKVTFQDDVGFRVEGGRSVAKLDGDVIYLAVALRNVGAGIAVLDRWCVAPEVDRGEGVHHLPLERFRRLTRDIYIPAGGSGFWQGALRDRSDPEWDGMARAVKEHREVTIDVLYGDYEGGQRTITRFVLRPIGDDDWYTVVSRHWNLDRDDPR